MSDYDIIVYIQPALMDDIRDRIGGPINVDELYRFLRVRTATHCITKILEKPDLCVFHAFYFWWNAKMNNDHTPRKGTWFAGALALRKERDGLYVGYLFGHDEWAFSFGPAQTFQRAQQHAESVVTAQFGAHKLLDEIMYGKVLNHPIYSIDIHMESGQMILDEGTQLVA